MCGEFDCEISENNKVVFDIEEYDFQNDFLKQYDKKQLLKSKKDKDKIVFTCTWEFLNNWFSKNDIEPEQECNLWFLFYNGNNNGRSDKMMKEYENIIRTIECEYEAHKVGYGR